MLLLIKSEMKPFLSFPPPLSFSFQTRTQSMSSRADLFRFSSGVNALNGFGNMVGMLAEPFEVINCVEGEFFYEN